MKDVTDIVNEEALAEERFSRLVASQGIEEATTDWLRTLTNRVEQFSPLFIYRFLENVETQWTAGNHPTTDVYEHVCLLTLQYARKTKRPTDIVNAHQHKLVSLFEPKGVFIRSAGLAELFTLKPGAKIGFAGLSGDVKADSFRAATVSNLARVEDTKIRLAEEDLVESLKLLAAKIQGVSKVNLSLDDVLVIAEKLTASELYKSDENKLK